MIIKKTYFALLFSDFDGEDIKEKRDNFKLGYKAQNYPETLTPKECFIVSFIIERMQTTNFSDIFMLEELRFKILEKLK